MYITQPYDDALAYILENGELQKNRTGVDCLTVFSLTTRYLVSDHFPILTKRKLSPKAVFAELLWMLSGSTNNDDLIKLGANFWTPWAEPEHPDNKKFYEITGYPVGYLGPIYGWQMRYFGASYSSWLYEKNNGDHVMANEALREGFDQISWLVNEIKDNPTSRRLIVSLWNPKDMHLMRLPPCHFCFHVNIDDKGRMSLLLNQRSCDFPIGIPANISFYTALLYMLCQQTGYTPHEFIHHGQDCHIYQNQIDAVKEYLDRPPVDSPKLKLSQAKDIFSYKPSDFEIVDYNPHRSIKIPVTV